MPHIIALEGRPSKGKSTTIGLLFDLMRENDYDIVQDKKRRGSKEFFVILSKTGKKIGVTTYGDNPGIIRQKLEYFIRKGCTIAVIACRPYSSNDGTKAMIESYVAFDKQYVSKTVEVDSAKHALVNQADAKTMFDIIENVI